MRLIHLVVGLLIVGGLGVVWLWGLATWIAQRLGRSGRRFRGAAASLPGKGFWRVLAVVQVALILQAVVGGVLFLLGGRVPLLHYVYGALFPLLVLIVAHVTARDLVAHRPWAPFTLAAFFSFGLTLRALQTGLVG